MIRCFVSDRDSTESCGHVYCLVRNIRLCENKIKELDHALSESLKLQAHYGKLLNDYDNGKRLIFEDTQAWLDRLRLMGAPEKEPVK